MECPQSEVHVWWAQDVDTQVFRRTVLASYLRVSPSDVSWQVGAHGKPSLGAAASYEFSVSHSGALNWLAIARHPVGMDGQLHRAKPPDYLAIARRYFTPRELAALQALSEPVLRDAFYRVWTRKEAMVKALGRGLAFGLARLEVSLQEEGMDCLLSVNDSAKLARHWSLGSIPVLKQDYTAAVAVAHPAIQVRVFAWLPSGPSPTNA